MSDSVTSGSGQASQSRFRMLIPWIPALMSLLLVVSSLFHDDLPALSPLVSHLGDLLLATGGVAMILDAMCGSYGFRRLRQVPRYTGLLSLVLGGIIKMDVNVADVPMVVLFIGAIALTIPLLTVRSYRFPPASGRGWWVVAGIVTLLLAVAALFVDERIDAWKIGPDEATVLTWVAIVAASLGTVMIFATFYFHVGELLEAIKVALRQPAGENTTESVGPTVLRDRVTSGFDLHQVPKVSAVAALRSHLGSRPDAYVSGDTEVVHRTLGGSLRAVPSVLVVLGIKHGPPNDEWVSWREGKPPDVVIDIAAATPGQGDPMYTLDTYRQMGISECWQIDLTGRLFDQPLAGHRLEGGAYRRIDVSEESGGILQGESVVLGVQFRVDPVTGLSLHDPSTGEALS